MKQQKGPATVIDFEQARQKRVRADSHYDISAPSYPRIETEDPVRVTLVNGTVISTPIEDISVDGIKLCTSRNMARTLYVPGQLATADDPPSIHIAMDLPLPHGDLRVQARCRLVRFDMISPDEVTFTLEFLAFEGAGEAIVRHFIRLCGDPDKAKVHYEAEVVAFRKRGAR
jgi:hypothetical protein